MAPLLCSMLLDSQGPTVQRSISRTGLVYLQESSRALSAAVVCQDYVYTVIMPPSWALAALNTFARDMWVRLSNEWEEWLLAQYAASEACTQSCMQDA